MNPGSWHPYESDLNPRLNKQTIQIQLQLHKVFTSIVYTAYTLVQRNMRSNVSRFWGAKLDLFKWTLAANIHISVDWCHTSTLLGGKSNNNFPILPRFLCPFLRCCSMYLHLTSACEVVWRAKPRDALSSKWLEHFFVK